VLRVAGDRGGGGWYLAQQVADLVRVCVAVGRPEGRDRLQAARSLLAALEAGPLLAEADAALAGSTGVVARPATRCHRGPDGTRLDA
jgi:hypothetical protein